MFGHVVASHNARDPERREAYLLKQLQDVPAWQGSIVHKVLAKHLPALLQSAEPITAEAFILPAQDLARRQFAFSAAKLYRVPGRTKTASGDGFCALVDHELGRDVRPGLLDEVCETLALCFDHFVAQKDLLRLLRSGSKHKFEPNLFFNLDGVTVAAVPDLVFTSPAGRLVVVDWKVGESETSDYSTQVLGYALAVGRCGWWPGVAPEDIELYEVNLLQGYVRRHPADAERLLHVEDFIYASSMEMRDLIGGLKYSELDPGEFDVANVPTTCAYCSFQPLCKLWLAREGRSMGYRPERISEYTPQGAPASLWRVPNENGTMIGGASNLSSNMTETSPQKAAIQGRLW
jgi:hypothetical protein